MKERIQRALQDVFFKTNYANNNSPLHPAMEFDKDYNINTA